MARRTINQWNGGISNNSRSGPQNSWRFAKHLNIYTDDDSVSLNPIPAKVSSTTVVGLGYWMVDCYPWSTDKYGYDSGGNIYKITSSDVFTLDRSGATIANGAAGQGMQSIDNGLYYATDTTIGRKYPLSGTPAYDDDFLSDGVNNLDLSVTASGNTYTPPVAIAETAANLLEFTPTKDPLAIISVYVTSKGTGNWTITVHDDLNNNMGSGTISNASLTNSAMNDFTMSSPIRINIGQTYHFHVTSTVADGTLRTGTASDLSTAQYSTYFGILIGDPAFHAMGRHTNGTGGTLVIANANYFAEYVPGVSYDPNKIEIIPGYEIRYFVYENEFIVGMAWKGNSPDDFEDGMAFYWDGIQPYYNFKKPITGGLPNTGTNYKNRIFSVLGSNGTMTLGTEPFRTIQPMPLLGYGKKVEAAPGAITTWQNRVHLGMGINSDDEDIYQGVYEFGNNSDRAVSYTSVSSEVLNFGYTISTGDNQGTTMAIGCVQAFGEAFYIWWKSEAGTYGVDKVTKTNNPAATGSYESLIDNYSSDGSGNLYPAPQKLKEAQRIVMYYDTLPTGCTVTPKYRLDGATAWVTSSEPGTAGSTFCILDINERYYEIEYGYDLAATTSYPRIIGFYYEFLPLEGERDTPHG